MADCFNGLNGEDSLVHAPFGSGRGYLEEAGRNGTEWNGPTRRYGTFVSTLSGRPGSFLGLRWGSFGRVCRLGWSSVDAIWGNFF